MKKLLTITVTALMTLTLAAPSYAADNTGGTGGGSGDACELTNSCGSGTPPDPTKHPDYNKPCLYSSGTIRVTYTGDNAAHTYSGDWPGVPFAPLSNTAGWDATANTLGGIGSQTDPLYGITYGTLTGISWSTPGFNAVYVRPDNTLQVVCQAIQTGNVSFAAVRDYSMPRLMLDGWCAAASQGYLEGPFERDNTTRRDGYSKYVIPKTLTAYGEDIGYSGTGWRSCYSAPPIDLSFDRPLVHFGRYIGPIGPYIGSFLYAVYWPGSSAKFGWTGQQEGRFGPLGDTSLDPNRSKYVDNPIEYLTYPGAFEKNCEAEITVINNDPPGLLTPAQVKWGQPNWAQPLYTGPLTDPASANWTDSDPLFYSMSYCGKKVVDDGPNPRLTTDDSPALPDLTLRCTPNDLPGSVLLANGDRRDMTTNPVQVRADQSTALLDWMPDDLLAITANTDTRNETWRSKFVLPTTVGQNSPSSRHTSDVNAARRQPYGTVPADQVTAQNLRPSSTWRTLNAWGPALTDPERGIGVRFAEASVEDRYFQITPYWRWEAEALTRTQTVTSLASPLATGSNAGVRVDPANTVFTDLWMPVRFDCTGEPIRVSAQRVASVGAEMP